MDKHKLSLHDKHEQEKLEREDRAEEKASAKDEAAKSKPVNKTAEVLKKELSERAPNPAAPKGGLPKTSPAFTIPLEANEVKEDKGTYKGTDKADKASDKAAEKAADDLAKETENRNKRIQGERNEAERVAVDILNLKDEEAKEKAENPELDFVKSDSDSKGLIIEAKRIMSERMLNKRRAEIKAAEKKVKVVDNDLGYAKRDLNEAVAQVALNADKARNITVWTD